MLGGDIKLSSLLEIRNLPLSSAYKYIKLLANIEDNNKEGTGFPININIFSIIGLFLQRTVL
jgi:hypothetical protein